MKVLVYSVLANVAVLAAIFLVAVAAALIIGGVVSVFVSVDVFDTAILFGYYAVVGIVLLMIANEVIDLIKGGD